MILDEAPLPVDGSIRRSEEGKVGYVTDALEQALLLLRDMIQLRSIRKHEVFLSLKRELAMVSLLTDLSFLFMNTLVLFNICFFFFFVKAVQSTHKAEEIVINTHRQMKDDEAGHIAAVDAFKVAEKSIQELTTKLNEFEHERKSAAATLERLER